MILYNVRIPITGYVDQDIEAPDAESAKNIAIEKVMYIPPTKLDQYLDWGMCLPTPANMSLVKCPNRDIVVRELKIK